MNARSTRASPKMSSRRCAAKKSSLVVWKSRVPLGSARASVASPPDRRRSLARCAPPARAWCHARRRSRGTSADADYRARASRARDTVAPETTTAPATGALRESPVRARPGARVRRWRRARGLIARGTAPCDTGRAHHPAARRAVHPRSRGPRRVHLARSARALLPARAHGRRAADAARRRAPHARPRQRNRAARARRARRHRVTLRTPERDPAEGLLRR
jgi:hypothetical protein